MTEKNTNINSTRLLDSVDEIERILSFNEVIKIPDLHQQKASLTPLEKAQIGILLTAIRLKVVIETGVWRGRTTRFISEFLTLNGIPGTIYGFDFPEVIDELFEFDRFFSKVQNVKFIKGVLPGSLKEWINEKKIRVDFALIDAYHSYYAAYTELYNIESYLNTGGYIFCHDYDLDIKAHEGVLCAVNDFANRKGFTVLPFLSKTPSPKTDRSAQSAILRRKMNCPYDRRIIHWRQYTRQRYPKLAKLWRRVRGIK